MVTLLGVKRSTTTGTTGCYVWHFSGAMYQKVATANIPTSDPLNTITYLGANIAMLSPELHGLQSSTTQSYGDWYIDAGGLSKLSCSNEQQMYKQGTGWTSADNLVAGDFILIYRETPNVVCYSAVTASNATTSHTVKVINNDGAATDNIFVNNILCKTF